MCVCLLRKKLNRADYDDEREEATWQERGVWDCSRNCTTTSMKCDEITCPQNYYGIKITPEEKMKYLVQFFRIIVESQFSDLAIFFSNLIKLFHSLFLQIFPNIQSLICTFHRSFDESERVGRSDSIIIVSSFRGHTSLRRLMRIGNRSSKYFFLIPLQSS